MGVLDYNHNFYNCKQTALKQLEKVKEQYPEMDLELVYKGHNEKEGVHEFNIVGIDNDASEFSDDELWENVGVSLGNIEKNEKYNIDSIVAHFQAEINVNGKKSILSFDEVSRVAARFIKNSYSENPLEILEEDEKIQITDLGSCYKFLFGILKGGFNPKKSSRYIPKAVRTAVWNRDGGACVDCGSSYKIEYDHIIPFSKGGSNTYNNIQILCESCNRSKSNKIDY